MTDLQENQAAAEVPTDPAAHAVQMVGHHYRVEDFYEVGREKVREFARAVQDAIPRTTTSRQPRASDMTA